MNAETILARHAAALERRRPLEPIWQACYDQVLPAIGNGPALFDATAADAAEQLAASLLAELTPPWSRWFGIAPARPLQDDPEARATAEALEDAAVDAAGPFRPLQFRGRDAPGLPRPGGRRHRRAAGRGSAAGRGFGLPLHRRAAARARCWRKAPTAGSTPSIARPGSAPAQLRRRFPGARAAGRSCDRAAAGDDPRRIRCWRRSGPERGGTRYAAILTTDPGRPLLLAEGRFAESPFIAFRWLKVAGRDLWPRPGDEGAAGYPHRQQGGGAGAEERLHRRHRHLAGRG